MTHLLFFSGSDCPHCDIMRNLIARLSNEWGVIVDEREVWQNESNYRLLENYTREKEGCSGVPVFVNTKTGVILCGEVSYQDLMHWAQGGNVVQ